MLKTNILFTLLYIASAQRQLTTENGDLLWIASILDDVDCNKARESIIKQLNNHKHKRILSDDLFEKDLFGVYDCFIHFSGTKEMADDIEENYYVETVDRDEEISIFWNLDRSDQRSLPLDNKAYEPTFKGTGQSVYVIDTGIYKDHNDFEDRASYGADFIKEGSETDLNGHGTHCASTAAGKKYGIAPEANIIGVKVLNSKGFGALSSVIEGIQWVENNATKTSVLSISLGGSYSYALNKVVQDAAQHHIIVVAAGNDNKDACGVSPASAEGSVITVGSTTSSDYRSSFSNYGNCVDIFAPGSGIKSAFIGSPDRTGVLSGTSMATPYVAGVALQALQKHNGDLMKSRGEVLSSGISNILKNIRTGSSNLLSLSIQNTTTIEPPTSSPTIKRKIILRKGKRKYRYKLSTFGNQQPNLSGKVIFTESTLCESTQEDFTSKIVLVKRGNCLFYTKVLNAQRQGAIAVLIINYRRQRFINPGYYGKIDDVTIPSAMIKYVGGKYMRRRRNKLASWG